MKELTKYIEKAKKIPGMDIVVIFLVVFAFYKLLGLALGNPYPLNVVVSPSMEPLFHPGDLVVIKKESTYSPGDIVLYYPNELYQKIGINRPIVHRVVAKIYAENKKVEYWKGLQNISEHQRREVINLVKKVLEKEDKGIIYITKGDNNSLPDFPVYPQQIYGKVLLHIPYLAYPRYLLYLLIKM